VAAYYPRKVATVQMVQKIFKEIDLETWDEDEEERREHLQMYGLNIYAILFVTDCDAVLRREERAPPRRSGPQQVICDTLAYIQSTNTISQSPRSYKQEREHRRGTKTLYKYAHCVQNACLNIRGVRDRKYTKICIPSPFPVIILRYVRFILTCW
jgi:hypothetical protein